MGSEYFSIPEAAARLGISRIAVFKRVKKGQLEALRFGRNWAVPAAALERTAALGKAVHPAELKVPPRAAPPSVKKAPAARPEPDTEMDSMGWD